MSASAHALPTGTRIAGYEIMDCIGAGGSGITYTGFNRVTERQVAIKEFFPQDFASRSSRSTEVIALDGRGDHLHQALQKFESTTKDLSRLSHPNIVRVIDYYPGNNTAYMIMEYLRGRTLEAWLAGRPRPPRPSELAPLLEPVLDALDYLHGRGLIHRDVAPDNILLCDDDRPVLIDFGAASLDRSTVGSAAPRTVAIRKLSYTAPDQSRGTSQPNPTADVYSFGAVLYRALSGTHPADGEERVSGLLLAGQDPYRTLETAPPVGTSRMMGRAIDQCLMLDLRQRPESIRAARRLFDWSDSIAQIRTLDPQSMPRAVDAFSRDRDVISQWVLDDDIFDREQAPNSMLDLQSSVALSQRTHCPTNRGSLLRFATLFCVLIGIAIWLWFLVTAHPLPGR